MALFVQSRRSPYGPLNELLDLSPKPEGQQTALTCKAFQSRVLANVPLSQPFTSFGVYEDVFLKDRFRTIVAERPATRPRHTQDIAGYYLCDASKARLQLTGVNQVTDGQL